MENNQENNKMDIVKNSIRTIPNWPKEGIMFRDITTLLETPEAFDILIDKMVETYKDENIDAVAGIESRGFIFAGALAKGLKAKFVLMRKPGKLPYKTIAEEYSLEYGTDKLEVHEDSIKEGEKVIVIDDLIATGGTALAGCNLVKRLGGNVHECCFVVDLPDLGGAKRIQDAGYKVRSFVEFEGE